MTRGERIAARRKEIGMTQVDLAAAIGESKQTIYKYENGVVTNIPLDKLEQIAKALKCKPTDLAGWTKIDPAPTIPPARQALIDELMKCSDEELKAMIKIKEMMGGK